MIGTAADSAKLGVVAIGIWAIAYGWYFFIGTGRVGAAIGKLMARMRGKAAGQKPKKTPRSPAA